MKKPILYNPDSTTDNVKPIFSQGDYDVFVGSLEEDKLPVYVVINRNSNVVEFTHEVSGFYRDWLNHFAAPAAETNGQLSLSLKN